MDMQSYGGMQHLLYMQKRKWYDVSKVSCHILVHKAMHIAARLFEENAPYSPEKNDFYPSLFQNKSVQKGNDDQTK